MDGCSPAFDKWHGAWANKFEAQHCTFSSPALSSPQIAKRTESGLKRARPQQTTPFALRKDRPELKASHRLMFEIPDSRSSYQRQAMVDRVSTLRKNGRSAAHFSAPGRPRFVTGIKCRLRNRPRIDLEPILMLTPILRWPLRYVLALEHPEK